MAIPSSIEYGVCRGIFTEYYDVGMNLVKLHRLTPGTSVILLLLRARPDATELS